MPKNFAAASLFSELVTNGVPIRDGSKLRFMHESVQEYFTAVKLKDAPTEDLTRRAPILKLAALMERSPMFEVLVTWAGFARQEQVVALVATLVESHSLLAAHLAAESRLATSEVTMLRRRFLALTDSSHETRRELGAVGLAIVPSTESEVLERLVEMLNTRDLGDWANKSLNKLPPDVIIPALVKAWVQGDQTERSEVVRMFRN